MNWVLNRRLSLKSSHATASSSPSLSSTFSTASTTPRQPLAPLDPANPQASQLLAILDIDADSKSRDLPSTRDILKPASYTLTSSHSPPSSDISSDLMATELGNRRPSLSAVSPPPPRKTSRRPSQSNTAYYAVNDLNSFSFGNANTMTAPRPPVDPLSRPIESDDEDDFVVDTTPRPSVAEPYTSRPRAHTNPIDHEEHEPVFSRHPYRDNSDAVSHRTFGTSSASASTTSLSSSHDGSHSTRHTSAVSTDDEARFSDDFEDYDDDISIGSARIDERGSIDESYRWSASPYGRRGSNSFSAHSTQSREAALFSSRRASRSADGDLSSLGIRPNNHTDTVDPITPSHSRSFTQPLVAHSHSQSVSSTSTVRVDDPHTSNRLPEGFDEEWGDIVTGIVSLPSAGFVAPGAIPGPRRPSANSIMTFDDSFQKAVGGWDADGYGDHRNDWTFRREKADGSGVPRQKPTHKFAGLLPARVDELGLTRTITSRTARSAMEKEHAEQLREKERRSPAHWKGMAIGQGEVWGNSLIGRYTVDRTSRDPIDSNKGQQHRLSINHFRDSTTKLAHKSPPSTIHRHSKAQAFSIGRFYRHKAPAVYPPSDTASTSQRSTYSRPSTRDSSSSRTSKDPFPKSTVRDGPATRTEVKGTNLVLLAPWRVQEEYTATNTTRKLESHGHLTKTVTGAATAGRQVEERPKIVHANSDVGRRRNVGDSELAGTSTVVPTDASREQQRRRRARRSSLSSDEDEDRPHRTPHSETYSTVDPNMIEQLRGPPERGARAQRGQDRGGGGLFSAILRSTRGTHSTAHYDPPWMVIAPRQTQEHHQQIVKNLNNSFTGVGLLPAPGKDRAKLPKPKASADANTIFDLIPQDAMLMLLPLWPGETDASSRIPTFVRPDVPMEDRLFLIVYYQVKDFHPRTDLTGKGKSSSVDSKRRTGSGDAREDISVLLPNYHISACIVTYAHLRGTNLRLPEEGLAISGSLEAAYAALPRFKTNDIQMIANCGARESGVEFDPIGLDCLGLCTVDTEGLHTPTPIGRAVMEMAWLGGMALTSFGSIS